MLKKFFLVVCGSFVGAILAFTFLMFATILMSFALFDSMSKTQTQSVEKNSILHIKLSGELVERTVEQDPFMMYSPGLLMNGQSYQVSLQELVSAIDNAKDNDKIKGIYIECDGMSAAPASLMRLRKSLTDFKTSKKFIYAYGDEGITQGDYYVASVADSIFINPEGAVDLHGLASQTPYLKTFLENVGVQMQVIRVGRFKSAVEPYMLDSISPENREQQELYLGNIWGEMTNAIASDRHITKEKVNQLADSICVMMSAEELMSEKLVDKLCYKEEFEDKLRKISELDPEDDLKLVEPAAIAGDLTETGSGSDKIVVLYAVGEIDGSSSLMGGEADGINSKEIVAKLRELRLDEDVKGLVLRVNSPGGSAFGSEVMWKALDDFKKSGRTVAVSMGDYAASGGYYISCNADRIFAEPTTITGSIGIFGVVPCYRELAEDKLGVHFSTVSTNANGTFGSTMEPLTPFQQAALQRMVDRGYDLFTKRCADGRHVSQDSIKQIAEGRVWDAKKAKDIGLVDEFGGIDEAVKWVAKKAGLKEDKYTVSYEPNYDVSFWSMMTSVRANAVRSEMRSEMGMFYDTYEMLERIMHRDHVLCLMEPIEIR